MSTYIIRIKNCQLITQTTRLILIIKKDYEDVTTLLSYMLGCIRPIDGWLITKIRYMLPAEAVGKGLINFSLAEINLEMYMIVNCNKML